MILNHVDPLLCTSSLTSGTFFKSNPVISLQPVVCICGLTWYSCSNVCAVSSRMFVSMLCCTASFSVVFACCSVLMSAVSEVERRPSLSLVATLLDRKSICTDWKRDSERLERERACYCCPCVFVYQLCCCVDQTDLSSWLATTSAAVRFTSLMLFNMDSTSSSRCVWLAEPSSSSAVWFRCAASLWSTTSITVFTFD